ncbi:MAG TPA: hypothetical protein VMC84_05715 [Methanocella sp.]|uniref:hypothetical protein n=1 Tax=Methanocella sp. TaxID=2052833 RepID=UPI002B8EBE21|nr:hypothetical protein [Methanocella sp.]HTY90657.1 hypothetical protein [Methanocella sp.]
MELKRSFISLFASLLVLAAILFIALPITASAQQQAFDSSSDAVPLSFILDNALDTHAQDIQENIFEYEFNAAGNDPGLQSALVLKRSDQLANETNHKKAFLQALIKKNDMVPDDQAAEMADSIGASVDRLGNWSKKLGEHAAGLSILNGHKAYSENVIPLISDINETKGISDKLKANKKNSGNYGHPVIM